MKISMRQGVGLFFLITFLVMGVFAIGTSSILFSNYALAAERGDYCDGVVIVCNQDTDDNLICSDGECKPFNEVFPPDPDPDPVIDPDPDEGGGSGTGEGGGSGTGEGGGTAPGQTFKIENKFAFDTLEEALSAIANFLFIISIPIAVIFIIIGGFQFVTAAGSPEKISAGKKTITWAVIGIAVLLVAGSIAKLIENILS